MKLLVSAYACAPNLGSEHASAWGWTAEASRLGHEVWALVSPAHRNAIEATSQQAGAPPIRWVFPEVRHWPLPQGREPKWERTYNLLWQREASRLAAKLHSTVQFDIVHHLTWAGIRAPTFLGSLGVPLIIGPIGGGEASPIALRDELPFKGRLAERLRDISNATININPLVRGGLRDAAVIFARTADTRSLFTASLRQKTLVMMELGVALEQIGPPRPHRAPTGKMLYAGRLLHWKGVHIAIAALAQLAPRFPHAHLTIVGDGPEHTRLKKDVAAGGLEGRVDFVPRVSQDKLRNYYETHDFLLFPSLHDSAGWVVVEAMCRGMPVVCLDLGGPRDMVTSTSGIVVGTAGLNTHSVATALANRIGDLLQSPVRIAELSTGATERAHDFLLSRQVTSLYERAGLFMKQAPAHDRRQRRSQGSLFFEKKKQKTFAR